MPPGFDMLKDKVPARSIRLYDTRAGLWKLRAILFTSLGWEYLR